MPRLHHLNLSLNLLEVLKDETFAKNEELEVLDISDNYIQNLTNLTFKGLEVLEVSKTIQTFALLSQPHHFFMASNIN